MGMNLYVAIRGGPDEPFGEVIPLAGLNTPLSEECPKLSGDGLRLYFTRCGGDFANRELPPDGDIYVAARGNLDEDFGNPVAVEELNSRRYDGCAAVSEDGCVVVFSRGEIRRRNLYIATRDSPSERFANLRKLKEINTLHDDTWPDISRDGLTIFWCDGPWSHRDGGHGRMDLWMATRSARGELFGEAVNLGFPVNTPVWDANPGISDGWPASGSVLYFARSPDIPDLYQATWHPDCNANGVDDLEEIENGDAEDVNGNGTPDACEGVPK